VSNKTLLLRLWSIFAFASAHVHNSKQQHLQVTENPNSNNPSPHSLALHKHMFPSRTAHTAPRPLRPCSIQLALLSHAVGVPFPPNAGCPLSRKAKCAALNLRLLSTRRCALPARTASLQPYARAWKSHTKQWQGSVRPHSCSRATRTCQARTAKASERRSAQSKGFERKSPAKGASRADWRARRRHSHRRTSCEQGMWTPPRRTRHGHVHLKAPALPRSRHRHRFVSIFAVQISVNRCPPVREAFWRMTMRDVSSQRRPAGELAGMRTA